MDQIAKDEFSEVLKKRIFQSLGMAKAIDLGGFESFVFATEEEIVRVTHESHRDSEQLLAEMEFLDYLAANAAAVCQPRKLPNNELVMSFDNFLVSVFARAPGDIVQTDDWHDSLFLKWGEAIGRFHRLAQLYRPTHRRFSWREDENVVGIPSRLPDSQEKARVIAETAIANLEGLPSDNTLFGLVHGDAHPGNFHVNKGELTFFDFDDASYVWFAYDIATVLFSAVLQRTVEATRQAQEAAAKEFLPYFLEGYSKEFSLPDFVFTELPNFLKLRELSLYAVVHQFLNVDQLEDWFPEKFMQERQGRIEAGEPFLDLNFDQFR